MCLPKAYKAEQGYKYQILCRQHGAEEWEHCDYAVDEEERDYLVKEYTIAYRGAYEFLKIQVPQKYWN